ncbi:hypothetical protein Syun_026064 [Stephania yunnanensis]|uniref:Uncharacterized protein n=1 Tax=Stephania yunnanensis TaxID=152371 RepID=A0AAP0ETA1_9MAGN
MAEKEIDQERAAATERRTASEQRRWTASDASSGRQQGQQQSAADSSSCGDANDKTWRGSGGTARSRQRRADNGAAVTPAAERAARGEDQGRGRRGERKRDGSATAVTPTRHGPGGGEVRRSQRRREVAHGSASSRAGKTAAQWHGQRCRHRSGVMAVAQRRGGEASTSAR